VAKTASRGKHTRSNKFVPKKYDRRDPPFDVRLVILYESLERESQKVVDYIIAHEIAHAWLDHGILAMDDMGQNVHERNEEAATRQAREWGFVDPRPPEDDQTRLHAPG